MTKYRIEYQIKTKPKCSCCDQNVAPHTWSVRHSHEFEDRREISRQIQDVYNIADDGDVDVAEVQLQQSNDTWSNINEWELDR